MKILNVLLLSINEEKKIKNFPTDKWDFIKNNEEVSVSTEAYKEDSQFKIKLSITKNNNYSHIQLSGTNLTVADILETLSPASVEKCLFSLIGQINEKLYEEYDFQVAKNGKNVNSAIDNLKFAENFVLAIQDDLLS